MRGLALAVLLAAPARAQRTGEALFDATGCRACHSVAGVGGNAGPDLTLVGFRRSRPWLDMWLSKMKSWKHDTRMPDYKLDEAERAAMVDYLASQGGAGIPALRARWKDGETIYRAAGCVACHGAQGRGGMPNNNILGDQIPAVYKSAEGFSMDELKNRIRSGRTPEPKDPSLPPPMAAMPAWGKVLNDEEIDAVAKYLMSLAPTKKTEDF